MRVKGYQRDTVYFSILDDKWPAVKERLKVRLMKRSRDREGGEEDEGESIND